MTLYGKLLQESTKAAEALTSCDKNKKCIWKTASTDWESQILQQYSKGVSFFFFFFCPFFFFTMEKYVGITYYEKNIF